MLKMAWLATNNDLCALRIYLFIVAILLCGYIQTTFSSDGKSTVQIYETASFHSFTFMYYIVYRLKS